MQNYIPQVGDILGVNGRGVEHYIVYVGPRAFDDRNVIHNPKGGVVELTTLEAVSGEAPVYLRKAAPRDYFQQQAIVERAFQLIGARYDLFTFNCQHAATYIQTGHAESPQLQGAFVVGLALFGLTLLSKRA